MISSMTPLEKMNFVFTCYDFDESGNLTIDEMTLSLKSTITGLCKISNIPIPTLPDFEKIATLAFKSSDLDTATATITSTQFLTYISTNPTASSWLNSYDDLDADEATTVTTDSLKEPGSGFTPTLLLETSGGKNFVPPQLPPALLQDSAFLSTLTKAAPPPPPTPAEGEDPLPPPPVENTRPPNSSLTLSWIHGYSGTTSRGTCHYTANGGIAYPAATNVVVYNKPDEEAERPDATQSFFADSETAITATAPCPSGQHLAVGNATGTISILDTTTMATLNTFQLAGVAAVSQTTWSSDGTLLAATLSDADNTLVIYHVPTGAELFTTKTGKSTVLDIAFTSSSIHTLAVVSAGTGGVKPIVFYTRNKDQPDTWSPKKGVFGSSKPTPIAAVSAIGTPSAESFVAGTVAGELLIWSGRNLVCTIPAPSPSPITSLHYNSAINTLAVAADDGQVRTYTVSVTLQLTLAATIDLKATGSVYLIADTAVASVSVRDGAVLVGTRGNEIVELSLTSTAVEEGAEEGAPPPFPQIGDVLNGGPITVGHGTTGGKTLNGVGVNPASSEYATVGSDCKLYVWDAGSKKMVKSVSLDSVGSSVAYNADGALIAVGYSTGPKKGTVSVFTANAEDPMKLELKGSAVDGQDLAGVTVVKFGPTFLVAATDLGEIYMFSLEVNAETNQYPLLAKLTASETASAITAMDLSAAGTEIIANLVDDVVYFQKPAEPEDAPYAICEPFVNTADKPAPEMASFSTPFFTGLQGIYGDNGSGSYTAVAKPKAPETPIVVATDTLGLVSLFPFPSTEYGAANRATFKGHAGGLSGVGFTAEDAVLLTTGQTDGCIFQWTFATDEGEDSAEEAEIAAAAAAKDAEPEEPAEPEEGEYMIPVDSDDDEDLATPSSLPSLSTLALTYAAADAFKTTLMPSDAAGSIPARDLPAADLSLKWIHGVSAQSTRNAVCYNDSGDLVYPVAGTVVILNKASKKQNHFLGHKGAITALAMHPNKVLAASSGGNSTIVWDTMTNSSKKVFKSDCDASAVAFSADGTMLAIASTDADHTVAVYSWSDGTKKCSAKTGGAKILSLSFDNTGNALVAGGDKAFSVCAISGKNMSVKRGQFGSAVGGRKVITCVSWCGGDFVLGTADGKLFRLEGGRKLAGETPIFDKGHVNCLTALPAPADPEAAGYPAMLVAGELGVVKLLDEALGELKVFDLKTILSKAKSFTIRSVCFNKDQRKVLVATKGSEIYEISNPPASDEEVLPADINDGPLTTGHSSDQLWGVAAHPVKNEVATCGDDKMVSFWDLDSNTMTRSIAVGDFARSCDYRADGILLAVGLGGVRGGGAPGSWEKAAPAAASADEPEAEGDDAIAALQAEASGDGPPTDPWLLTLFAAKIKPREKEGAVLILSLLEDDVRIVNVNSDAKGYISDVKFSPDGNMLAAASMDSSVYVYDCLQDFKLKHKCEVAGGLPVIHLNWTADSAVFMTSAMRKNETQIKYWLADAATELEEDADEVSNASWNTWTSVFGKAVKGCYRKGAADPSSLTSVSRSADGKLVASGDSDGSLRIHKYPSLETGAAFKDYGAHSGGGGVGKVVFTKDDSYVVTVGAADRGVCVWNVVQDDVEDSADKEYGLDSDSDYIKLAPVEVEEEDDATASVGEEEEKKEEPVVEAELKWTEKLAGKEVEPAAADGEYEISAVYGVDSAAGVCYSSAGDAVYSCGAASVMYSSSQKKFVVYSGSSGGVTGLSTSASGKYGLVGDKNGGVNVFACSTGAGLSELSGAGDYGVGTVGWSPDGTMCAAVGSDADHSLRVWSSPSGNWKDGELYAESMGVAANVSFVCFTGMAVGGDGPHLVTGGFNHITFWTLKNGNITSKKGTFGGEGSLQPLTCGAMLKSGVFVSGTVGGSLFVWDIATGVVSKKIDAHVKCVTSVSAVAGGGILSSGKDGMVKLWNTELMNVNAFDVGGVCLGAAGDLKNTKLLCAMSSGDLKEIVVDSGFVGIVVSGAKSVWAKGDAEGGPKRPGGKGGLANVAALSGGRCVSGGDDGCVRVWGSEGGAMPLSSYDCGGGIGAIAAKDGVVAVAMGTGVEGETVEGTVLFLDGNTLEGKGKVQEGNSVPTCMVFGEKGLVYVGGADGTVKVYDSKSFEFKFGVGGGGQRVMCIDVTKGGAVIAVGGEDGGLKYFDAKGEERPLHAGAEWVNGSMCYRPELMGVAGVCSSGGGLVGDSEGRIGLIGGGMKAAHSGKVGVLSGEDGCVFSSSGANAGVFCWTKV